MFKATFLNYQSIFKIGEFTNMTIKLLRLNFDLNPGLEIGQIRP